MSAEYDLPPQRRWPPIEAAATTLSAEFWDDTESDWRNLQAIGWWLSVERDAAERGDDSV